MMLAGCYAKMSLPADQSQAELLLLIMACLLVHDHADGANLNVFMVACLDCHQVKNSWRVFSEGIQTAKLPIEAYIKLASSKVLTVNHVVDILLSWLECKDWKEAFFKVIPTRKRASESASAAVTADAENADQPSQDNQPSIEQADAAATDLQMHVDAAAASANGDDSCISQAEQPAQKRTKT